ncbi:hypothetical protein GLOIN_2v1846618 [Rhizophagus irregularis DAOM 181602=DAOM 197198]|nr:hypothetical protein GLOIN_2v1846618 [Rhizophagus irregularis DAOM 181602=DAOM 197198]
MSMDKSQTRNEKALDFVSKFNEIYFQTFTYNLSSFVTDGFLKDLFEKNPSVPKDKARILIERFALYAAFKSWDNFSTQFYCNFGDTGDDDDDDDNGSQNTDDYLMDESYPLEPDVDKLLRCKWSNIKHEKMIKFNHQM